MKIAAMTFHLYAPWVRSLKEKRMIVKSLISKLQNRYHVSVAEIEDQDNHKKITIGIAAIVLAFDVTIGAIICGAIGCSMAKKLKGPDGQYPTGKAKVGAILSKVGLIIGIVTTIIAIIWIILWIVAIIAGAGYAMSH